MNIADIPYCKNAYEIDTRWSRSFYTEWYGAIRQDGSINVWKRIEFSVFLSKGEAISDENYRWNVKDFFPSLTPSAPKNKRYARYLTREECYEFVRTYWDDEKKCIDITRTKYKIEVSEDKKQVDGQMMLVI